MDGATPPPLPKDTPPNVPPLPPSEPLPQHRPSKRLGIGDGDGAIVSSEPPVKKTKRGVSELIAHNRLKGKGLKSKEGVLRQPTAAELQALEDGELEDSDDSGVKDTYLVIEKKGRKVQPSESSDINIKQEGSDITIENGGENVKNEGNEKMNNSSPVQINTNSTTLSRDTEAVTVKTEQGEGSESEEQVEEKTEEENGGVDNNGNPNGDDFERDFEQAIFSHEFAIIDDVDQSDNEDDENEAMGEGDEEYDSDLMDEEIEAMLEEEFKKRKEVQKLEKKDNDCDIKEKLVVVEHDHDPFDILPEGWCQLSHNSGIHVYLHRKTRVCTLSRPYFLGSGSARRHDVPLSAIPCMHYKKSLGVDLGASREDDIPNSKTCDEENSQRNENSTDSDQLKSIESETKKDEQQTEAQSNNVEQMETDIKEVPVSSDKSRDSSLWNNLVLEESLSTSEKKEDTEHVKKGVDQVAGADDKKKADVDQSAEMILKLQEDLNQLAALAQGSPKTPNSGSSSPDTPTESKPEDEISSQQDATNKDEIDQSSQKNVVQTTDKANEEDNQMDTTEKTVPDTQNETKSESISEQTSAQAKPDKDVRITSVEEHKERNMLNSDQVHDYCKTLFQFKKIYVKRFRSWKARRDYAKQARGQKPTLPGGTKLLMCVNKSAAAASLKTNLVEGGSIKKKDFILNPKGKSDICILHEYAQHAMRVQPRYTFEETGNAEKPYKATILINEIKYGTGMAANKKGAKAIAALETLKILIPNVLKLKEDAEKREQMQDLSYFDDVKIEDPRVPELTQKAGQPLPFEILHECLKRNYGLGDTNLNMEMNVLKHQKSEFVMKVAKYTAKVICKSKKEGKQRAAQVILQQMHPHVHSWGSLLRLYAKDLLIIQDKKDTEKETSEKDKGGTDESQVNDTSKSEKGDDANKIDKKQKMSQVEVKTSDASVEATVATKDTATQNYTGYMKNISQQTVLSMINFVQSLKSKNESECSVSSRVGNAKFKILANAASGNQDIDDNNCVDDEVAKILVKPIDPFCFNSDSIRIPFRMHKVTQTDWYGRQIFHKATQYPDHDYLKSGDYKTILPTATPTMNPLQPTISGLNTAPLYYPQIPMLNAQISSACGYSSVISGNGMGQPNKSMKSPVDALMLLDGSENQELDCRSTGSPSTSKVKPLMEINFKKTKMEDLQQSEKISDGVKVKEELEHGEFDERNKTKGLDPSYVTGLKQELTSFMPRSVLKPVIKGTDITNSATSTPEIKKDITAEYHRNNYDNLVIKKADMLPHTPDLLQDEKCMNKSSAVNDVPNVDKEVCDADNKKKCEEFQEGNNKTTIPESCIVSSSSQNPIPLQYDMSSMMYGQSGAVQYVNPQAAMGLNGQMMVNPHAQGLMYMQGSYMPQYYYPGRVYYPGYGYM